jgi:hypothetical protein
MFPFLKIMAVSVGFEPTARITTNNTLAGCRFKPLIQLTINWYQRRESDPLKNANLALKGL